MAAGAYGERIGNVVRIERPPTLNVTVPGNAQFAVTRLARGKVAHAITGPPPREDASIVSLQLRPRASYDLWVEGRRVVVERARAGTSTLINLNVETIADLREAFDAMVFYVPRAALDAIADDQGVLRIDSLHLAPGKVVDDAVIRNLGASLLPALENPAEANRLFLEHVAMALQVHVAHAYGGMPTRPHPRRGQLSPRHERRVKELLMTRLDGEISLDELARECGLSRAHLARAFKMTTGQPPHRWLLARRIERAQDLLGRSNLPLAEITRRLGFADQSHFTRVFGRALGITPGAWRRSRR